ncbi:MAG: dienelactone hydrolase family protein [Sphingomonadales bacterium]|nr:dienelactone hydrolase family protein [Sphingomonadales bacterium]MBD3774916.1 dienelactone hydrolase family protein [Paracoccaceae bacterium]
MNSAATGKPPRVPYADDWKELGGELYRPSGAPRAAVAVFPTIMNPTKAVRDKAEALAEAGYLAMICDFYGATPGDFGEARVLAGELRADVSAYRRRLHAGLHALANLPEADGLPMAAIGFCMGGQAVLELARDGAPLSCVASFHGLLDTDRPAVNGAVRARVLVCHGDADPMVPRSAVTEFWDEMDRAGANWHFHSYSGVKHGFTNPYPVTGSDAVAYDKSADRQSWAAMLSLFDEIFALD